MTNDKIELIDKISNCEGIKCINRMKYHNDCISIFGGNHKELSKALLTFENLEEALKLMDQENREAAEEYHNEISRLLHNFLASAKMLVDHTSVFVDKFYKGTKFFQFYKNKVKGEFEGDGLCKFVHELRNFILHRGLPYTGLSLRPDLKTTVFLDRDLMLDWDRWTVLSRNYLKSQPERMRVYDFIKTYTEKIYVFNNWLNLEIKEYHKNDLDELNLLRKRYREISNEFI